MVNLILNNIILLAYVLISWGVYLIFPIKPFNFLVLILLYNQIADSKSWDNYRAAFKILSKFKWNVFEVKKFLDKYDGNPGMDYVLRAASLEIKRKESHVKSTAKQEMCAEFCYKCKWSGGGRCFKKEQLIISIDILDIQDCKDFKLFEKNQNP
jgi:hypothetical protein